MSSGGDMSISKVYGYGRLGMIREGFFAQLCLFKGSVLFGLALARCARYSY